MIKMTEFGNMGGILHCPKCDHEENMHQMKVDVFQRLEDHKDGVHVAMLDRKVFINSDIKKNPSPRRDGLTIHFYCSYCGTNSKMDIFQHKGNTFMKIVHQETYVCPKLDEGSNEP